MSADRRKPASIGSPPIIVCAAQAYLERLGMPMTPADLSSHDCLHLSELRWGRNWQFRRDDHTIKVPMTRRLECNDGPTLLAAAIAGSGIALESAFVVGATIRRGDLVPILPEWHVANVPLYAVYSANRHIARRVRRFVDLLARACADNPDLCG